MWPCLALLLAFAPDPARALAARIEEVATLDAQVRQVALVVAEGKTAEARAPAGLATLAHMPGAAGRLRSMVRGRKPCQDARCWAARASWLLRDAGQPDLSAQTFERAVAAGGQLTSDERSALLHA